MVILSGLIMGNSFYGSRTEMIGMGWSDVKAGTAEKGQTVAGDGTDYGLFPGPLPGNALSGRMLHGHKVACSETEQFVHPRTIPLKAITGITF
jgi:hypothetical protein